MLELVLSQQIWRDNVNFEIAHAYCTVYKSLVQMQDCTGTVEFYDDIARLWTKAR